MSINKQRALDYVELEWGTYVARFNRLPEEEQTKRVKEMGYESFRDLLAHILAWWEEAMGIIHAVAQGQAIARKQYDFDVFNAQAVQRYKPWDEAAFLARFEKARQKMWADLKALDEPVFDHRRVKNWLHGAVLHHAREHLVTLSRFLSRDMLQHDWSTYIEDFQKLDPEKQEEFLSKQGYETFHDLLAHIVGWWEESARIVNGILNSPSFAWQDPDPASFNQEMVHKYATWSDEDLFKHFHTVRLALIELVETLPEDAFLNQDIEAWLADDVVRHHDDHAIPG